MASHQYHQYHEMEANNSGASNGGGVGGGGAAAYLCSRQSSSRWIPTADQIRILRELYYTNGVRSPSAEQIQRITARLRHYGRIEGKNVFYWFQNHKARERQKRKLTLDGGTATASNNSNTIIGNAHAHDYCCIATASSTTTQQQLQLQPYGVASATAASHGFYDAAQAGNNSSANYAGAGGSIFIERSFRECCLTGGGDGPVVDNSNIGWVYELEPTVPWMYQCMEEEESAAREIQILPLFPTRSQEQEEGDGEQVPEEEEENYGYVPTAAYSYWSGSSQNPQQEEHHHYHHFNSNGAGGGAAAASLELTLNSYYYAPPGSS